MDPVIVFGLTASALVVLIVQVAKAVSLPVAAAPWFTLLCSLVSVGLGLAIELFPTSQRYVEAGVSVLVVFLVASGLYDAGKNIGTTLFLTTGKK